MGETRNGCVITEHSVAHPGSSPRTLERCRARGGGPPCVSCCDRVHELRSDLDGRAEGHERPVAAGSDDACRRNDKKIAMGENKVFAVALRIQAYAFHVRRTQEYENAVITVSNQQPIRIDSQSFARSLACLQRPKGALTAMLMGRNSVKPTRCLRVISAVRSAICAAAGQVRGRRPAQAAPPGPLCRGRHIQAPFSNEGRYTT
ncbi:MAG: hypothetical protein OXI20_20850 [Rhodospirillales bacterium]|nr:hypothetical protein [Rhodospirillales bacterium]